LPIQQWLEQDTNLHEETLRERVMTAAAEAYAVKVEQATEGIMRQFERSVMLQSLDTHWREHLGALDHLRQGIHLRSYAQKNPKQEYKREAFELFASLLDTVKREVTQITMMIQVKTEADVEAVEKPAELENVRYQHADYDEALANEEGQASESETYERAGAKIGRNDPCPCGSGKKYKQCHGKLV
jgi:preprotein translocase subunit SecA